MKDWTGPGVKTEFLRRVDSDGYITLPWVGKLEVGGCTNADAARAVDQVYFEKNLIHASNATVERIQIASDGKLEPGPFQKGDFVHIQMWELQGTGVETRLVMQIGNDGVLELPHKITVKAPGLSEAELEEAIAVAYRELIARLQICVLRVSPEEAKVLKTDLEKR